MQATTDDRECRMLVEGRPLASNPTATPAIKRTTTGRHWGLRMTCGYRNPDLPAHSYLESHRP